VDLYALPYVLSTSSNDMQVHTRQFRLGHLPQRAAPQSANSTSFSPALKLIALVIFLPLELSFYIFDFRLTLIRLVLFLLTPILFVQFGQSLASKKHHLLLSDVLILSAGIWMIVSPAVVVDLGYSLHHSAPSAVEFCGSYFATRVLLSRRGQALSFINLMCHVIAIVALLGVLDALTSRPLTHDIVQQLTGFPNVIVLEHRLGVVRAMGPIDHPILFGIVCAIGLLLAIASPVRAKGLTIVGCGLGVLVSLSSAPIQGAILGLGLLAYDGLLARLRSRWLLLLGVVALGFAASYAFTASPLDFLFGHLLIDSSSYWVRVFQWNTVGIVVLNSPWFGIAFQWPQIVHQLQFFALESVDSLWLLLALTYGIPGAVLVGLSMVSATWHPTSGRGVNLTMQESKLATTLGIAIAVVALLGFTVDFWEASWIFIGLLVGIRAHLADLGSQHSSRLTKADQAARANMPSSGLLVGTR
jgi:O-antigen ligase